MSLPSETRTLRRWIAAALLIAAVGVAGAVVIRLRQPTEVTFTPVADAYVSTAHPDAKYGSEPTLRADATPKIRSYLRFHLDGLSGRVVKAKLRLWSPTGALAGYSVHPVTSAWVEREITWRRRPAAATPVAGSGAFGPGSWSSVDVARLLDDSREVSLVVTTRSGQTITFDSREGLNRPELVIWTTSAPKPSARAFSRSASSWGSLPGTTLSRLGPGGESSSHERASPDAGSGDIRRGI